MKAILFLTLSVVTAAGQIDWSTNWMVASPYYRAVNGTIYHVNHSDRWETVRGRVVAVVTNGVTPLVIVSTETRVPAYRITELPPPPGLHTIGGGTAPPGQIIRHQDGYRIVVSRCALTNFPNAEVGWTVDGRALRTGSASHSGEALRLLDWGTVPSDAEFAALRTRIGHTNQVKRAAP